MTLSDQDDDFEIVDSVQLAKYIVAEKKPDLSKIRAWLRPTEYGASSSEYHRHLSSQASGTGEWIRETPSFSQWHSSDRHGSIWVKAVPGAGKSVIAASMVDSFARNESVPVLYFFFRQVIEANRTGRALLQDWLAQLLSFSHVLQVALWELVEEQKELESLSSVQLWKHLLDGLRGIDRAYCVVDALDEMTIDEYFLSRLNELGNLSPQHVKVLMTSRPKQYLQQALRDPQVIHVSLEEELVQRDISVFVNQRTAAFGHRGLDQDTQVFVRKTICERSQGLFLYARLMLDQIAQSLHKHDQTSNSFRNMVAKLPVGLEEMYNQILADHTVIAGVSQSTQVAILRLVTHSVRPLRLIEVAEALVSDCETLGGQNDGKAVIRNSCGPLLEILEDEVVQILHHSFTEFLLDNGRLESSSKPNHQFPSIDFSSTHRHIAINCLEYLSALDNREGFSGLGREDGSNGSVVIGQISPFNQWDLSNISLHHPFLDYAVRNCFYHAKQYGVLDLELFAAMEAFCKSDTSGFNAWLAYMSSEADPSVSKEKVTCLHVAAGFGLTSWAEHLIDAGVDVDFLDGDKRSPLFWAAKKGHDTVVDLLLKAGAKPDIDGDNGLKPLHVAALRNHSNIAKLLLAHGVSPLTPKTRHGSVRFCGNSPSSVGQHPLMYASQCGNVETVTEMLPYAAVDELEQALCWAAERGHSKLISMLLNNSSISPNARSRIELDPDGDCIGGQTALTLAVKSMEPECVSMLLDKGADARATSSRGTRGFCFSPSKPELRTALHVLASRSSEIDRALEPVARKILSMLLSASADMEAKDWKGNTPLLIAADHFRSSHMFALDMFLSAKANPAATNYGGETPLHRVCRTWPSTEAAIRLLSYDASLVHARASDGKTSLHCAVLNPVCPDAHIHLLVESGADIDAQDSKGETAIHHACGSCSDLSANVLDALLAHGANLNVHNRRGESCAHLLRAGPFDDGLYKVSALLDNGANFEACNHDGMTVLLDAVSRNSVMLDALLQHPKKPSISARVLRSGKTVLHLACQLPRPIEKFEKLLRSGANPKLIDNEGNTLLHEAAARFKGHVEEVRLLERLVQLGVPVNAKNHEGRTAAHIFPKITQVNTPSEDFTCESLIQVLRRLYPNANVEERDKDGYTPLHLMSAASEQLTFGLISAGADLTAMSIDSRTPLHCAARARQSGNVMMILQSLKAIGKDIDINAKDRDGRTALHDACCSGRPESVRLLIDAGVDINKKDNTFCTPLMACAGFIDEDNLWQGIDKCTIIQDEFRPRPVWHHPRRSTNAIGAENRSARIGVIAEMLIRAGADTDQALERAILAKDAQLITIIRREMSRVGLHKPKCLAESLLTLPTCHVDLVPDDYAIHGPGQDLVDLIPGIDESVFEAMVSKGFDCTRAERRHCEPVIARIASAGLTEHMTKIISYAKLMDDPTREDNVAVGPLLQIACRSGFCNLDMVRLLVTDGQIDVNAHRQVEVYATHSTTGRLKSGPTALHVLAEGDYFWQVDAIRYLVEQGAHIEALNEQDQTPLDIASSYHGSRSVGTSNFFKPQCCEVLLDLGANPNRVDSQGSTPLNKARSDSDIIKILLKHGADINAGKKGSLTSAIEQGHTETIKTYLELGADCNFRNNSTEFPFRYERLGSISSRYPLLMAAMPRSYPETDNKTCAEMVRMLLDYGAEVSLPLSDSETMIHYLFCFSRTPILRPFVQRQGLEVNARDQRGRTVFMAACDSNVRRDDGGTYVPPEEERRGVEYVPSFLMLANSSHYGPLIDYQAVDKEGCHFIFHLLHRWTPAVSNRFLRIPGNKSLVRQKDYSGFSPLHRALQRNKPWTCFDFIRHGADLLEPDPHGNSALHLLCAHSFGCHENYWLMTIFLMIGGQVDARNDRGQTALHVFLANIDDDDGTLIDLFAAGTCDAFGLLTSWGADVNATDNDGNTALHVVAAKESDSPSFSMRKPGEKININASLFRRVAKLGGNPLKEDKKGRTALDIAAAMGNEGILKLYRRTRS